MSLRLDIPAQEAHVLRVFAVMEDRDAPLTDEAVLAALGAEGLKTEEIELFDLEDLQDMPLSAYLAEGHGIGEGELRAMRGQLDGLTGRVLLLPSRAARGRAMVLDIGAALRLVGRFEEERPPVRFAPLPAGGAEGGLGSPAGARPKRLPRWAVLGAFLGPAVLVAMVIWLARGQ